MYSFRLLLCVFAAFIGAIQYGLLVPQLNVSTFNSNCSTSPSTCVVFPGHSTFSWTFATSLWVIGGAIGALFCRYPNDTLGRKRTLSLNALVMIGGGLLQSLSPNMGTLMLGRFVSGVASGIGTTVAGVYISEIAPSSIRGKLGAGLQMSLVSGILLQQILAFGLGTASLWRLLLGVPVLFGCLQILLYGILVESPVWLYQRNRELEAAKEVKKLFPKENIQAILYGLVGDTVKAEEVESTEEAEKGEQGEKNQLANISIQMVEDDKTNKTADQLDKSKAPLVQENERDDLWGLLFSRTYTVPLLIAVGLGMCQQFSGINAVFYYSSQFFEKAGFENIDIANVMIGLVNFVSTAVAILFMDYYGRRTLLLFSAGGMFLCAFAMTFCLYYNAAIPAIFFTCLYVSFFEFGLGPIPWLIFGEIFPENLRALAGSITTSLNWVANLVVGFTFPYVVDGFHNYSFVPFMVILFVCFFFVQFIVIETKGKTLEEIERIWQRREQLKQEELNKRDPQTESTDYDGEEPKNVYMTANTPQLQPKKCDSEQ